MKIKITAIILTIAIIAANFSIYVSADMLDSGITSLTPIESEQINENNSYPFDFELLTTNETTAFVAFSSLYANHTLYLAKKGEDIDISRPEQTGYMLDLYTEYVFDYTYVLGNERISYGGKLIVHDIDGEMLLKYREVAVNTSYNGDITESVLNDIMSAELLVAGRNTETEENGTSSTADVTYDDYDNYGAISAVNDIDIWRVYFDTDGSANFWLGNIPSDCDYDITVYEGAVNSAYIVGTGTNSGNTNELVRYDVTAYEYYYIKIESASGCSASQYLFRTKITASASSGDSYEPNDSIASAEGITTTVLSDATIHSSSDVDWFAFHVESIGSLTVTLSNIPTGCDYDMRLYDRSHRQLASSRTRGTTNETVSFDLTADGWYYVYISSYDGYSPTPYRLTISATASTTPMLAFHVTNDSGTPIQGAKVYVYCPYNEDLFDGNDMPLHVGSTTDSNGYVYITVVSCDYPRSTATKSYNINSNTSYGVNVTSPDHNSPQYAQYSFPDVIYASQTVYDVVLMDIDNYPTCSSPFANNDITPASILYCQNFGWRYGDTSDIAFHTGIDISKDSNGYSNQNDNLLSIVDGYVETDNFSNGCGHYIQIKFGEKYYVSYLHMVDENTGELLYQSVTQGQIIGKVGNTNTISGGTVPYHLHISISTEKSVKLSDRHFLDPAAFISSWGVSFE